MAYGKSRARSSRRSRYGKRKSAFKRTMSKRRSKSVGFRLKKVEKKVRVLTPERKFRFNPCITAAYTQVIKANTEYGGGTGENGGWFGETITLGHISQGTDKNERVGNQLIKKSYSCVINYRITPHVATEGITSIPNRYLRVVVVQTKSSIDQFTDGDWLIPNIGAITNRVFAPFNPDRLKDNGIRILVDKVVNYTNARYWYNLGAPPYGGEFQGLTLRKLAFRSPMTMTYDNAAGGSILTPIYVLFFDDYDNITIAPTVQLDSITERWSDNC